jgi:chromosome segregation ATPase
MTEKDLPENPDSLATEVQADSDPPVKNLTSNGNEESSGFFRRALSRTKEALKTVDEVFTGREAARRIDERFHQQSRMNEAIQQQFHAIGADLDALDNHLTEEVNNLRMLTQEQQQVFERLAAEVKQTAQELRQIAVAAEQTLSLAKAEHHNLQLQANTQLSTWKSDAARIQKKVSRLEQQLASLQQSFKQFLLTVLVLLGVLVIMVIYLLGRG